MKILILSRYDKLGASSRMRFFQYIKHLESQDHQIKISPFFNNRYIKHLYSNDKPAIVLDSIKAYLKRSAALLKIKKFDIIWIEKEIFPYFPPFTERILKFFKIKYIVDYDDAVFHIYDMNKNIFIKKILGKKIDAVMKNSSLVAAGNDYILKRAQTAGADNIKIIPTVVDIDKYPLNKRSQQQQLINIGWIGSPATSFYLKQLENLIREIFADHKVKFSAIGGDAHLLKNIPVEIIQWKEKTEAEEISRFDIGIMPLDDSPWSRGKCGYKLIQYMASGLPVVASPVGVNKEIVEHGINGFLADSPEEWKFYIEKLLKDKNLRIKMGKKGRQKVENFYSKEKWQVIIEDLMKKI